MIKNIKKLFLKGGTGIVSIALFFSLLFSVSVLSSCQKDKNTHGAPVYVDKPTVELMMGQTKIINLNREDGTKYVQKFEYSTSDASIVSVAQNTAHSVQVTAIRKGTATIKFVFEGKELTATVTVNETPPDNVTRILAIGNSFSEDALETYLYPIAMAAGDSVVVANLFIGGASLEDHLNNAKNNRAVYSFRKIGKNGVKATRENVSIEQALAEERWDFISFQQVSQLSGQFNTIQSTLPELFNYVKERVFYSKTKYVYHQTWAYAQNSTHDGFANYGKNQTTMYNAITDAADKASKLVPIDIVVPAGTAIQNGRTTFWGDNFCRDGYHLDLNIGRYLAACTWYEALFGKPVTGNTYNPNLFTLSATDREMAQKIAHAAVQKPKEVTDMVAFKNPATVDFVSPVYVNFAQDPAVFGWNGVTSYMAGSTVPFLRDKDGNPTKAWLTITERFNGINGDGVQNTSTDFNMPAAVAKSSYFGNSKAAFGDGLFVRGVIKISNLNPAKSYNFCYYGSRGGTAEKRQTKYITKGQNEAIAYLNTGNNSSSTACTNGVKPDANGDIFITVTAAEDNDNSTGFFYITAMRISAQ